MAFVERLSLNERNKKMVFQGEGKRNDVGYKRPPSNIDLS